MIPYRCDINDNLFSNKRVLLVRVDWTFDFTRIYPTEHRKRGKTVSSGTSKNADMLKKSFSDLAQDAFDWKN